MQSLFIPISVPGKVINTSIYPICLNHIITQISKITPTVFRMTHNAHIIGMTGGMNNAIVENDGVCPGQEIHFVHLFMI